MTVASRAVMMAVMTEARTTDVEQEGHTSLTISTLVGQELVEGPIVSSPAIYRDCLVDLVAILLLSHLLLCQLVSPITCMQSVLIFVLSNNFYGS